MIETDNSEEFFLKIFKKEKPDNSLWDKFVRFAIEEMNEYNNSFIESSDGISIHPLDLGNTKRELLQRKGEFNKISIVFTIKYNNISAPVVLEKFFLSPTETHTTIKCALPFSSKLTTIIRGSMGDKSVEMLEAIMKLLRFI